VHGISMARPDDEKEGIKGPISQYNFFSMESRKLFRDSSCGEEVLKRCELMSLEHDSFFELLRCLTTSGTA
jgi:hypothetical protein